MSRPAATSRGSATSTADEIIAETFKVLVLGGSDVGKTSIVKLYAKEEVATNLLPTVGMDFTDVLVSVSGTKVRLRVWDTAGQERFFTFTKQFFRGTQGIMLMYDITSMASYQTLVKWLQTVKQIGLNDVVTVMVGNKVDIVERREVPLATATKLASRNGFEYMETSAVTGKNVKKAFYQLAEGLIFTRGIFLPGEEADTLDGLSNDVIPNTAANNGAFRIEEYYTRKNKGAQNGGGKTRASNRKLRHDSEREQPEKNTRCCSS